MTGSDSGSQEQLPTLRKVEVVKNRILDRYFAGQDSTNALPDALDYVKASLEDGVFNPNYGNYGDEEAEEEIELWQKAVEQAEQGEVGELKLVLLTFVRDALSYLPDASEEEIKFGTAFLNLANSIK